MGKIRKVAETAENPSSIGRITPVNMQSETGGLTGESLIRDMTAANHEDGNDCRTDICYTWA